MNIPELTPEQLTERIAADCVAKGRRFIQSGALTFMLHPSLRFNAFADASNPANLVFGITSALRDRLYDVSCQFTREVLDDLGPRRPIGWRAALLAEFARPGANEVDHIQLFRMALSLILGHELGHIRQSHHLSKTALGLAGTHARTDENGAWNPDANAPNHEADAVPNQYAAAPNSDRFVFELAADYEGMQFCMSLFVSNVGSAEQPVLQVHLKQLWLFMCAATLVFFVLEREGRPRPPFGFVGTHPAAPARLLWMIKTTLLTLSGRPGLQQQLDADAAFDYLVDAVDFSTHFWHGLLRRNGAAGAAPEVHPSLVLDLLPSYGAWQSTMTGEWNRVVPVINEHIAMGRKLPLFEQDPGAARPQHHRV